MLQVSYQCTQAGKYRTSTLLGGVHIKGSPWSTVLLPARAHGPATIATGSGISTVTAGVQASLSLLAKDEFHNRLSKQSDAVHANFERLAVSFDVKAQSADTYEILYTVTTAGKHALSVKIEEQPVSGSPFVVSVHPGVADAATSVLHEAPSALAAGVW